MIHAARRAPCLPFSSYRSTALCAWRIRRRIHWRAILTALARRGRRLDQDHKQQDSYQGFENQSRLRAQLKDVALELLFWVENWGPSGKSECSSLQPRRGSISLFLGSSTVPATAPPHVRPGRDIG